MLKVALAPVSVGESLLILNVTSPPMTKKKQNIFDLQTHFKRKVVAGITFLLTKKTNRVNNSNE